MAGDTINSVMRVGDVGCVACRDLQFYILRKPMVRLGLCARPEETGWAIDGVRESQVSDGIFARKHIGALLQACDGARTLDEIGGITGVGSQAAFEVVSLLWTGGTAGEGNTELAPGDPPPELARLFSRLSGSTSVNDSWQDVAHRLATTQTAVAGDAELAGEMVAVLEPVPPEIQLGNVPHRGDTFTVLVETADSVARSQEVVRRYRQEGIALLRVRTKQEAVTIGFHVNESFSPCLACICAGEPEIGPHSEAVRHDIIVGLAARAVAALLARATVTHLPGDTRRTNLATFTYFGCPVVSRPGCLVYSVAGVGEEPMPMASSAPVRARYKQSVAVPPTAFVDSKGHQQYHKPFNLHLQRESRDWPVCPCTPLSPADLECLDQPWSIAHPFTDDGAEPDVLACPTLSELVTALALLVGIREPLGVEPTSSELAEAPQAPLSTKPRRWTAAGGNVGSVTAYVLVPKHAQSGQEVAMVVGQRPAPGTYVYIGRDHALALIGSVPSAADTGTGAGTDVTTEAGSDPPPDGIGTRIVSTGNTNKVARKHLSLVLRIAVQDCGCSFEVFHLAAGALGMPLRAWACWNEQHIARVLDIDPTREPAYIAIDLGGRRAHQPRDAVRVHLRLFRRNGHSPRRADPRRSGRMPPALAAELSAAERTRPQPPRPLPPQPT